MLYKLAGAIVLAITVLFAFEFWPKPTVYATITTGRIAGTLEGNVERYFDIPYAAAPVGKLRWAPPQEAESWQGTLNAKTPGSWCPQMDYTRSDEGTVKSGPGYTFFIDVPAPKQSAEDCLNLNVWTQTGAKNLPVVVFIHGNALSGSHPFYSGRGFAEDGVVFVSINYRMLTMGNFANPALTADAAPDAPLGRYTTLDQMAALQWVQDNIAAFGGNPDRVTLMGHSAGGAAIAHILATPEAEGLFQQAIIQSGNGWWSPMSHQTHEQFSCLTLRYSGYDDCDLTVSELRSIPWSDLAVTGPYSIDGRMWEKGATDIMAEGGAIDVPLMIGFTSYDGSSMRFDPKELFDHTDKGVLATYEGLEAASKQDLAIKIYTDQHSAGPARWVAHMLSSGAPTYLYQFSHILRLEGEEALGAEHGAELPFVFDNWPETVAASLPLGHLIPFALDGLLLNEDDQAMTRLAHECWVTFIKTGIPACEGAPDWPAYTRENDTLMNFTVNPTLIEGFRATQLNAHEAAMDSQFAEQQRVYEELLKTSSDRH